MKESIAKTPFGSWDQGMHLGPWVLLALVSENEIFQMFEALDRGMERPVLLVFSWEGDAALVDLHHCWEGFSGPPLPRVLQLSEVEGPGGENLPCLVLEGSFGFPFSSDLPRSLMIEIGMKLARAMQELLELGLDIPRLAPSEVRVEKEGGLLLFPPFPPLGEEPTSRKAVRNLLQLLLSGLQGSQGGPHSLGGLSLDLKAVLDKARRAGLESGYASPQEFGFDLRRILFHEPIPSPARRQRKRFFTFLKWMLVGGGLLLFVLGAIQLVKARGKSLVLAEKKVESFGSLLSDFQENLDQGAFQTSAQLLKNLESFHFAQGGGVLHRAMGDFQRKLRGHLAEVFLLAESPINLKSLHALAGELSFLQWAPSALKPRAQGGFLKRIQRTEKRARTVKIFLHALPSLSSFLEGERTLLGKGVANLREEFSRFCGEAPKAVPEAIRIFTELRDGLSGRRNYLLPEVFQALPAKQQVEWLKGWLPKASARGILLFCMSKAFRERKRSLPTLTLVSRFLEGKQEDVLRKKYILDEDVCLKVARELRSLYPSKPMWSFWGSHYPLFERLLPMFPLTAGSAVLLLRGILDPKGTEREWLAWVRQGDVRVFFHPQFCQDPRLIPEAERLVQVFQGTKRALGTVPLFWQGASFRSLSPLPLLFFNGPRSKLPSLKDRGLRSLFWRRAFDHVGEATGINYVSMEKVLFFPEEDWARPFFEANLIKSKSPPVFSWNPFKGPNFRRTLEIFSKRSVFKVLDPRLAKTLESGSIMGQKFCLEILRAAKAKYPLPSVWNARLRSILLRVASPHLQSLALSCIGEAGDVEMQAFLKLRGSSLPDVRRRVWGWLFQKGHLEWAWDWIGGQEVPPILLPPTKDVPMVEALFWKLNIEAEKGSSGDSESQRKDLPLLSPRRAHYFKALESLRSR